MKREFIGSQTNCPYMGNIAFEGNGQIKVRNLEQDDAISEIDWGQIDKFLQTKGFNKNLPEFSIESLKPSTLFSKMDAKTFVQSIIFACGKLGC